MLEVGPSGAVTIYDRPAVFNGVEVSAIVVPRVRMAPTMPSLAVAAITTAASASQLSEDLIAAVSWQESRLRHGLVSRAGAIGEMQLMPGTARSLGVDPRDASQNYRGGAAYLRQLLTRYDGDLVKTLAAYNAGPGAVDRYGGVPPFKETQAYVAAVLERMSHAAESR